MNLPCCDVAIPDVREILCVLGVSLVRVLLDELCDYVFLAEAESDEGLPLLERLDRAVLTSIAARKRTENQLKLIHSRIFFSENELSSKLSSKRPLIFLQQASGQT